MTSIHRAMFINLRTALLALSILLYSVANAQLSKLRGTWISAANDVIVIDTTNQYDSNMLCTTKQDEEMDLYLLGDTLSFQERYYSSGTNYEKLYIDRYDLLIVSQTDSTLILTPVSELSKKIFDQRTNVKFTKQEYNRDTSITFEKIIYHTTRCYGSCPIIDLEIDSNKTIYLNGEFYKGFSFFEKDSVKSGQFTGTLSDSLYNELIYNLQTCNLRSLEFPERRGADAPVTTLIIYYNGQRKYLVSMFPPMLAYALIDFLYSINEKAELKRTSEKRTLEK